MGWCSANRSVRCTDGEDSTGPIIRTGWIDSNEFGGEVTAFIHFPGGFHFFRYFIFPDIARNPPDLKVRRMRGRNDDFMNSFGTILVLIIISIYKIILVTIDVSR